MSETMDMRISELKDLIIKLNTTIDNRESMIEQQTSMIGNHWGQTPERDGTDGGF